MDIYFGALAERYYSRRPLTLVDAGARGGLQPNWRDIPFPVERSPSANSKCYG